MHQILCGRTSAVSPINAVVAVLCCEQRWFRAMLEASGSVEGETMSDDDTQPINRVSALLNAYRTTADELADERTTPERTARLQDYLAELDAQLSDELERRSSVAR